MAERRFALIIANSEYQDPDLKKLLAPQPDAEALAKVLRDPEIGAFEVKVLPNEPSYKVMEEIEIFFDDRRTEDLLLLYFAGHGIKDKEGYLHFAGVNTRRKLVSSTSIPSDFVNRMMFRSISRRKILLLDCCNSGAFDRGMVPRGDIEIQTGEYFYRGRGTVVITASDAMQYSWEVDDLKGEERRSIFTSAIIDGLKTGNADLDGDGNISHIELYNYTRDRVIDETPLQKPQIWDFRVQSDLIIAKNPFTRSQAQTTIQVVPKKEITEGIKGVEFIPKDDLILDFLHQQGIHVEDVLMTRGTIPGDKYIGQGERWFIQLNIGPSHVSQDLVTIYFNTHDAKTFKEKVEQSFEAQQEEGFSPESVVVNPDYHDIDHVLIGFRENNQKRTWQIILNKRDDRVAVIYFSERDRNEFSSKVGESLAGVK